jgi:hypothetical protein
MSNWQLLGRLSIAPPNECILPDAGHVHHCQPAGARRALATQVDGDHAADCGDHADPSQVRDLKLLVQGSVPNVQERLPSILQKGGHILRRSISTTS